MQKTYIYWQYITSVKLYKLQKLYSWCSSIDEVRHSTKYILLKKRIYMYYIYLFFTFWKLHLCNLKSNVNSELDWKKWRLNITCDTVSVLQFSCLFLESWYNARDGIFVYLNFWIICFIRVKGFIWVICFDRVLVCAVLTEWITVKLPAYVDLISYPWPEIKRFVITEILLI